MAHGLGRGLGSLIPQKVSNLTPLAISSADASVSVATPTPASSTMSAELQRSATIQIVDLPLSQIDSNPNQPRQHFDERSLEELRDSIREYGLLEPIVVTPQGEKYQIVAGERRWRAIKMLHRSTISAIIRSTSELERLALGLIENIQREDLNSIERARGIARLVNDFGLTQEQVARKLGKARSTIANTLRLLDLPPVMQQGLADGKITEGHAKVLLTLTSAQERIDFYERLLRAPQTSVRHLEEEIAAAAHSKRVLPRRHTAVSTAAKIVTIGSKDFETRELEAQLQESLGTKVSIKRRARGAQILIEVYSSEEFKNVVRKITTRR